MKKSIVKIGMIFIVAFLVFMPRFAKACDYTKGTITSISPQTIRAGEILTVTGSGFGTIHEYQTANGINYDKEIYFFWSYDNSPNERHDGGSFGGTNNGQSVANYVSWTDTEIKIRIPDDFETRDGGVINALNENINKFHLYTVTSPFKSQGFSANGTPLYTQAPENNYEVCSNPSYGVNATFYYQPSCTADTWSCGEYQACTSNNQQTRTCTKTFNCPLVDTPSPSTTQSCTYVQPTCTSWTYSDWGYCSSSGQQTRTILSATPQGCTGGTPVITQSCVLQKPPKITSILPGTINSQGTEVEITGENFGNLNAHKGRLYDAENSGIHQIISWVDTKIRAIINLKDWNKITNSTFLYIKVKCLDGDENCSSLPDGPYGKDYVSNTYSIKVAQPSTPTSPATPSITTPQTTCTEDTWSCNDWNSCSANGIQTRSCKRTFDCPNVETAPPETSQLCQASTIQPQYQPQQSIPESQQNVSATLIKATVKLLCPINKKTFSQGSGTVIDSSGTILTNRHVIQGTIGCVVGFINDPSDDPVFSEVAFVTKISSDDADVALLKIDNVNSKTFNYINIFNGDAKKMRLGEKIIILGYPDYAQSGESNLTYTSGDFSGFGSNAEGLKNYFKTNAQLEHGNSGGGAYTSNNLFVGIPTLVIKGELNSLSYILSINKINSWINSSFSNISATKQHTGLSVSSLTDIIENENYDSSPPDLSNARMIIYGDKTKQQVLPNTPGVKQTKKKPLFQTSGIEDENGIAGYYVYFGKNINADPVKQGKFIKKTAYSPPTITKKGVYYFVFKVKDGKGNISGSYITEYRYKK